MAFPVKDSHEENIRALIAKAATVQHSIEAMHYTQAALNAAQAINTLHIMNREKEAGK